MIEHLLTALGLVFVIEGSLYALAPQRVKAMLGSLLQISDEQLRVIGLMAAFFGVCVVWFTRTFLL